MSENQFKELFPKFCADILSILDGDTPQNNPSFRLYRNNGLCTNFTDWCWLMPDIDPPKVANGIHYLFRELNLEPSHPFDEEFSDYLYNPDKYSDDRPSNMLRLQFLKDHANA